ncbi:MAG: hypothetical protein RL380_529, partial [Verrucomicrobiota bacterium]
SVVVEAVVSGVSMQDAFDVSTRLDGASLTASNSTSADTIGRVAYAAAGTNGTTTMYIYITGR